jgi:hypothetical protein
MYAETWITVNRAKICLMQHSADEIMRASHQYPNAVNSHALPRLSWFNEHQIYWNVRQGHNHGYVGKYKSHYIVLLGVVLVFIGVLARVLLRSCIL